MDTYPGYSYKRFKQRHRFFPWFAGGLVVVLCAFVANLFFGCVKFGPKPEEFFSEEFTFFAETSEPFTSRTEAVAAAKSEEADGFAGYVTTEPWCVVSEVFTRERAGTTEFIVPATEVMLVRKEHKTLFNPIFASFGANFEWLCDMTAEFQTQKITAREIVDVAVMRYKNLQHLAADLDGIQETAQSPLYATTLLALNKQAIALYMLSTEAASPNFLHELRRAACAVCFAYVELVKNSC